jgi:hypothetical protein
MFAEGLIEPARIRHKQRRKHGQCVRPGDNRSYHRHTSPL